MSTEKDALRGTLSNSICNASLYPKRAQPYILGGDMSDVLDRTADNLLAAGYRKVETVSPTAAEEAMRRYNGDVDSETGACVDDWGYSEGERRAFVAGALFESHRKPRTIGYVVVDRAGAMVSLHADNLKEAQEFADKWNADCETIGMDWDYRVAAITEVD